MKTNLTGSTQDYLKAIYEHSRGVQFACTTTLAEQLGKSPASVTGMLQRMSSFEPPLVNYRKHQGATLTQDGEKAALEVIRRHRLIETYLVHALGYQWDEVHQEADRLEHVISEDFESRISSILGNPDRDPHGEPIPTQGLTMPKDSSLTMSSLRPKHKARVTRVCAKDPGFLRHVQSLGLVPGATIKVQGFSQFDQNLLIKVNNRKAIVLGSPITNQIFVEVSV